LKITGISLFSGGLDSTLAVRVIQNQDIEVQCVTFETPFFSSAKASMAAKQIGLPLTVIDITTDHLRMMKAPRYGFGKNMNPCIDCHALMLRTAGRMMQDTGADFIFTGEVLGQRPMSQNKQSLHIVAKLSGFEDCILRPLSARLLPDTKPELEGKVDRKLLLDIQGRGRKRQMFLADQWGIGEYPKPAGGCLLTDPNFSRRLRDLYSYYPDPGTRDIELLKHGRHFRIPGGSKIVIGRNLQDNLAIEGLSGQDDVLLFMAEYPGPSVLVPRGGDSETLNTAASLCALYSDAPKDRPGKVLCKFVQTTHEMIVSAASHTDAAHWII
jgi:tRNA U34 2-thiouridine synthase MnmA/TrmU